MVFFLGGKLLAILAAQRGHDLHSRSARERLLGGHFDLHGGGRLREAIGDACDRRCKGKRGEEGRGCDGRDRQLHHPVPC